MDNIPTYIKKIVLIKYNYQCAKCGNTDELNVYHQAKTDPTNNPQYTDLDNLIPFCVSCNKIMEKADEAS